MKKIIFLVFLSIHLSCFDTKKNNFEKDIYKKTEHNYGTEVNKYSEKFYLDKNYLKALIILESGGNLNPPNRFEKHVYEKLISLKKGEISKFEDITSEMIKNTPDSVIRDMASSWGPFQIMGYKCVNLNIDINLLKGEESFFYGIKWIDDTYGDYVRLKQFKHAFHMHNTGKLYPDSGPPLTYNPEYVKLGLKHIKYFREADSLKSFGKTKIELEIKK